MWLLYLREGEAREAEKRSRHSIVAAPKSSASSSTEHSLCGVMKTRFGGAGGVWGGKRKEVVVVVVERGVKWK